MYKRYEKFKVGLFTSIVETWKPVVGFEGAYEVSSFGNVRSVDRYIRGKNNSLRLRKAQDIKQKTNSAGYKTVHLRLEPVSIYPTVHRLVLSAFVLNIDNKQTVNHKDNNKTNNNVSNLEWFTHSEQMRHAVDNCLIKDKRKYKYSANFKKRVHDHYVTTGCSIKQLATEFDISERTAGKVAKGQVDRKGLKITEDDVLKIRELRNEGRTLTSLADEFNCGTSQIHRIVNNKSRMNNFEFN